MRILVTGGTGFVGSHAVAALVAQIAATTGERGLNVVNDGEEN